MPLWLLVLYIVHFRVLVVFQSTGGHLPTNFIFFVFLPLGSLDSRWITPIRILQTHSDCSLHFLVHALLIRLQLILRALLLRYSSGRTTALHWHQFFWLLTYLVILLTLREVFLQALDYGLIYLILFTVTESGLRIDQVNSVPCQPSVTPPLILVETSGHSILVLLLLQSGRLLINSPLFLHVEELVPSHLVALVGPQAALSHYAAYDCHTKNARSEQQHQFIPRVSKYRVYGDVLRSVCIAYLDKQVIYVKAFLSALNNISFDCFLIIDGRTVVLLLVGGHFKVGQLVVL